MEKENTAQDEMPLLNVIHLKQYFKVDKKNIIKAVNGITFQIKEGETYGLVGESGSGKTTIGRSNIRKYEPSDGTVYLEGKKISGKMDEEKRRFISKRIQMIFQDPMASLNPRKKVIDIIAQGLDIHEKGLSKEERQKKVYRIMELVGLSKEHANRYPHEFSGGQRQRIGIARAIIINPKLIIADEAISSLDVSIQAQIVNLMKNLQKELGTTYLFIAHDLAIVKYISNHIGVLHLGYLVESGTTEEIFRNPVHPYTKSLLSAIPHPNPKIEKTRKLLDYDFEANQETYEKAREYHLEGEHYVLATEEQFNRWSDEHPAFIY